MIKNLKRVIKKTFVFKLYDNYRRREIKTSYGVENPDKIYYIIGFDDPYGGLFWLINKVLMHISYAEEKGYIPVVDMKNYSSQYLEPQMLHKENAWEYFFKQPCDISLESISKSKNIVLAKKDSSPNSKHFMGNFYENDSWINHFSRLFSKYIKLEASLQDKMFQSYTNTIEGKRVVGVLCRGTDYVTKKPSGHPIPPTPEQVIIKTRKVMSDFHCNYVFLATEDKDILDSFIEAFGDALLYNKQDRISSSEVNTNEFLAAIRLKTNSTVEQRKKMGVQYYEAIYLLSKCNCFISSRCGGAKGVLLMNNKFEYKFIFNLGMYK